MYHVLFRIKSIQKSMRLRDRTMKIASFADILRFRLQRVFSVWFGNAKLA